MEYYISLIFGGAPQSYKCIVNAPCTFSFFCFFNPQMVFDEGVLPRRSCVALENGMKVKREARAVFDFGIRCSPSGCNQAAHMHGRQSNAWRYIEYIYLICYRISTLSPFPHLPPLQASSLLTLVIITTSPLFLPVILFKPCLRVLFLEHPTTPSKPSSILLPMSILKLSAL